MSEVHDTGVGRLLALLEALAQADSDSREGLTVSELSRAMGRDKSIVSRQLKPMVELGVVERSEEGRHRLGWRLFAVAARAGDQRLLLLAPPVMRRLTQLLRERVHLSIQRGAEVFTILSESPQRMVEAVGWVGLTSPIPVTSAGRALLLDHSDDAIFDLFSDGFQHGAGRNAPREVEELIDRVGAARRRGYALVVSEFDDDLTAVAAPVRDVHGRIVAALNVSAPSYRLKGQEEAAGRHVSQAALHLSKAMASPPDSSH